MTYRKPQLHGYIALAAIQETGTSQKIMDHTELHVNLPSDPAYQADE